MNSIFRLLLIVTCLANTAQAQYAGHGVESVSAESIKKFAPPALPAEMANKLKKIFDISSPGMGMRLETTNGILRTSPRLN